MDQRARQFGRNAAELTRARREALAKTGLYDRRVPFCLPARLVLTRSGVEQGRTAFFRGGSPIQLVFDDTGPRSFPPAYKQLLIDTFTEAQSSMDAVFGQPSAGGQVHVRNYDADIGDRDAVAGGYYVPNNGSGEQEIRFPVYSLDEAAAVNFVHCLLLAYLGPTSYAFDAFEEGLVRAATMRVVRTAGAMPSQLDPGLIESVLDNTYDVGTLYDWFNQRGLGGPVFIAPNLRDVQLPPGGSLGGIYLHRYQMSGSAWQKVLVEYPSFAAELNAAVYADPPLGSNRQALISKGNDILNFLSGGGNGTIEGYSFADWFKQQFILETRETLGLKLVCHPVPLPPIGGSNDFGVFDVSVTYFETLAGGNEVLLSGTSYPIFWNETFDRVFPSAQEDRMDIAGAYGSVAPNLPDLNAGQPYRATADVPVQDRLARVYLPAGSIATGEDPTPNDFYGTVVGVAPTGSLRVRLTYGANVVDNIPVSRFAFGARINTSGFLGSALCRVEVIETVGQSEIVHIDRRVNKGPGALALDLRPSNGHTVFTFTPGIAKGLSAIGMPLDPYSSSLGEILGMADGEVLAARWNASKSRYDIFPDTGPFIQGHGYFLRMPALAPNHPIEGKTSPGVPIAVALRPGWNMVSNPHSMPLTTSDVRVVHVADAPFEYAEATGTLLGTVFFEFAPGPPDAATGAPETGTMAAATQFLPGRMYFVRVLVAEGVTLLFEPPGGAPARPASPPATPRFLMRARLERMGFSTEVQIGQSASATSAFDPREDSGLPPGSFGLQAQTRPDRLFRDVRSSNQTQIYRLRFDGLQTGKEYRLSTSFLAGALRTYYWKSANSTTWTRCNGPISTTIRAAGPYAEYDVRVEGLR